MALVSVTFTMTQKQLPMYSGRVLEAAIVRVFSVDGQTFVTQGTADATGTLIFDLEDKTTYWVRFFKEEYSFDPRLMIDVDSSVGNEFRVEGQYLAEHPPSTSNFLCKASGYVRGADWAPRAGVRFTFMLTGKPRVVGGQVMVISDVIVESGADGWVEVELVRNGSYDCVVTGIDDTTYRVRVPDSDSCSITDLIWPYVASLVFSPSLLTLGVGVEKSVNPTVILSNGVSTPFVMDNDDHFLARMFLTFEITDTGVASYEWNKDDSMTIAGAKAGSTTLTVALRDDVEAIREPSPARSLASLTIIVTE